MGNFSFPFVQGSSSSVIVDNSLSIALVSQRNKRREERKVERENETVVLINFLKNFGDLLTNSHKFT